MPEGPEVRSIVTDLRSLIVGRQILDLVTYDYTRGLFGKYDFIKLRDELEGAEIVDVERVGKFIILSFSSDINLVMHLRMTGQVFLRNDVPKYCRLTIKLDGEGDLHLADVRTFATCEILDASAIKNFGAQKKMGADALSPAFSITDLEAALASKRLLPVVLLDQTKISGLGNIYVNEVLFAAGICPMRQADSLSKAEIKNLFDAIKNVLAKAIKNRGTTFSDYRLPGGEMGSFQKHLMVFRRTGEKCKKCGAVVKRDKLGGRSVFYCEKCQN